MTIRHLFTRPFMNYAGFSGRSGRPEFWLFILTFVLVTQGAELIGSGVAALAIPDKHDSTEFHRLERDSLRHHNHDNESRVTFTIHRHNHSEGFHLHGMVNSERGAHTTQDGIGGPSDQKPSDHGKWHRKYNDHHRHEKLGDTLWLISSLALLIPLLAVGARRLHDSNHSGWWQLMVMIPIAGWLVLLVFMLLPGNEQENRFGSG